MKIKKQNITWVISIWNYNTQETLWCSRATTILFPSQKWFCISALVAILHDSKQQNRSACVINNWSQFLIKLFMQIVYYYFYTPRGNTFLRTDMYFSDFIFLLRRNEMSSLNQIMLIGNLGKDPEILQTMEQESFVRIVLATARKLGHCFDL